MIASIITKVMDFAALSAKERARVKALRDNVADEVNHNRKLLEEYLSRAARVPVGTESDSDARQVLTLLRRSDFEKVRNSEIPLRTYFPEPLSRPAVPPKTDRKGTRQHLAWIKNDRSVSDLLKRYYGNVEFLRSRPAESKSRPDVRYLRFLLVVIARSIKK